MFINLLTEQKVSFKTDAIFIFEDEKLSIYSLLYEFYKWYSYKMALPGFDEESYSKVKNIDISILDYSKTLEAGELRSEVEKVFNTINATGGHQEFKDIFFPLVHRKDFDKDAKDYLVLNLYKDLRANSLNFGVYNIPDFKTLPPNQLSKLWVAKIFSNSLILMLIQDVNLRILYLSRLFFLLLLEQIKMRKTTKRRKYFLC